MKYLYIKRIVAVLSLLILMGIFFEGGQYLLGTDTVVKVTLRNDEERKLHLSSFQINWTFPVTFLEEETCVKYTFGKEKIKDIYPISKSWNSCEKKEDWLFEVDFWDDNYVQGFVAAGSKVKVQDAPGGEEAFQTIIKGTIYPTAEKVSISCKDIRKISFVK
ncbi:MAG: hypothetical protein JSV88_32910 [Candidatus Aminicenantes bacterium]|nr:MAG: hypothetical protein JSV88_32910 [Candidatus Aminicenantes bacterium]